MKIPVEFTAPYEIGDTRYVTTEIKEFEGETHTEISEKVRIYIENKSYYDDLGCFAYFIMNLNKYCVVVLSKLFRNSENHASSS